MRIDVQFRDRIGIAHEVLAILAKRGLNVVAVEVDPPHVYVNVPELRPDGLADLHVALTTVPDVTDVQPVDRLPGERRRLHLAALLSAMPDPALLVNADGTIVVGNAAAAAAAGTREEALRGLPLSDLLDDPAVHAELISTAFHAPPREVDVCGEAYLLDCHPARAAGETETAGGVITFSTPLRLGEHIHALQHNLSDGFASIRGDSPAIQSLKRQGMQVATLEAPVLILGETGTGKELIAHACHAASQRKDAPFLALNCAAVPENLAESELFGYAPGAFSGAQRGGKPGLLELANSGTILLDEIGEMSVYLQAKLLRFLNDGSFRRVGGERELRVDVRIIGATHRDLSAMVADKTFREDLYYRLNVLRLEVPPLRERGEDILLLARHFISDAAAQTRRPPPGLAPSARRLLQSSPWPGNVRQLQNIIFRAVAMSGKSVLEATDLELADVAALPDVEADALPASWSAAEATFERSLLERLYPAYPSSRKLAARLNTSHTTIANKLRKYGIPKP